MSARHHRALAGAVLATLAVPLALAYAGGMTSVSQINRSFSVAAIHIHRGDTVRFTNEDKFDHQILIDSPSFHYESDEQAPGTIKDIPFNATGLFDVQCEIHPRMHLAVTVD